MILFFMLELFEIDQDFNFIYYYKVCIYIMLGVSFIDIKIGCIFKVILYFLEYKSKWFKL